MADDKKQTNMWLGAGGAAVVIIILIIWAVVGGPDEEGANIPADSNTPPDAVVADPNTAAPIPIIPSGPSISDVIRSATTWMPAYQGSYGTDAPDFTLTDLAGNEHSLSDYKGKDVILVFWATWCPPCKAEIPHLKQIRTEISDSSLAILAITDEKPEVVKPFVEAQGINYTVLLASEPLPAPYNQVQRIPSSFFIDAQGKIKLGTEGGVEAEEIKKILEAH